MCINDLLNAKIPLHFWGQIRGSTAQNQKEKFLLLILNVE
ncbi:hypothetical protein BSM4216_1137 [Bacillus smithii]|nr:hypothetical protein BSM4216_1137 [Bacillus smithii]